MSYFSVMGGVNLLITGAVIILTVWALMAAAIRPAADFALANKTKKFWVIVLVLSLAVSLNGVLYSVPLAFGWLLSLAAIIAPIYYLGPVQSRMGPRRRRDRRPPPSRGGW